MKNTWWKSGDYNAICDICGWKFKASELKERWDGKWVCSQDYDQRHPLDFPTTIRPEPVLPWTRPEQPDVFIELIGALDMNNCTLLTSQGVADYGAAGCAKADLDLGHR